MKRRNLLLGLIPVGFLPNIARAEGEFEVPSDADIQALYERVDSLQRQLDYKNVGNSPFQRSGDYAYGSVLDRQTGVLDVANTAAETTLYTFTLAPNTLYNNRSVRLEMYGDWLNSTAGADAMAFKLKLGSTTMVEDSLFLDASGSPLRRWWKWDILISADNSLNAQQASWDMRSSLVSKAATGIGGFESAYYPPTGGIIGTAAEDALQPLAITVTVDWQTASANLSWRRQFASLEVL